MRATKIAVPLSVLLLSSCVKTVRTQFAAEAPAVTRVMKRQVQNAVDAGDGDALVRSLRAQLGADPNNLNVRLELARHYERGGYPELAVEHYRLANERFPESAEAVIALARCLRSMELNEQALAALERYESAYPRRSANVLAWLGVAADDASQLDKAEKWYRKAMEFLPKSESLHNNLGYNLLLQGKKEEAIGEFRAALKLNSHSLVARNNLGMALASQPKEAVVNMQSVADPATAHNNLAAILIEQGDYKGAREELDIALGYNKDHEAALRNLQLVSELDGKPFAVTTRSSPTRWKRFASGLRRVFVGGEEPGKEEAVRTASK